MAHSKLDDAIRAMQAHHDFNLPTTSERIAARSRVSSFLNNSDMDSRPSEHSFPNILARKLNVSKRRISEQPQLGVDL